MAGKTALKRIALAAALAVAGGTWLAQRRTLPGPGPVQGPCALLLTSSALASGTPASAGALEALRAGATRYLWAWASERDERASLASILTGETAFVHRAESAGAPVPGALVTLAERAAEQGLATAALVAASREAAGPGSGLEQGFERYDAPAGACIARLRALLTGRDPAQHAGRAAARWLERQRGGFFLWLHLPQGREAAAAPALEALREQGRECLVVMAGARGAPDGVGPDDAALHTELWVRGPGTDPRSPASVATPVPLAAVAGTLSAHLGGNASALPSLAAPAHPVISGSLGAARSWIRVLDPHCSYTRNLADGSESLGKQCAPRDLDRARQHAREALAAAAARRAELGVALLDGGPDAELERQLRALGYVD